MTMRWRGDRSGAWRRVALVAGVVAVILAQAVPGSTAATTRRMSVSSGGAQGNSNSGAVFTSGPGRFLAYESAASNLVHGDTNHVSDIFLTDRVTRKTYRVSVGRGPGGGVVQANGPSHSARGVTPDGRFVTFESFATNLVGRDFNGTYDVFIRDRATHATGLVSVSSSEARGNGASADPVVSANGRFVAFESSASNLVGSDTNGAVTDVFLRDRSLGTTSLISLSTGGARGNGSSSDPQITPDGRFVVFESTASNLVGGDTNNETDIFVRDRLHGTTSRVSVNSREVQGNAGSFSGRITPDGRYAAFESFSSNLSAGLDTNHGADVFVRDRLNGTTSRVSVSSSERQGNAFSADPTISANGRYVAFESAATDFTANDNNAHVDVFIRDRALGTTRAADVTGAGHVGNAAAESPWFSQDGRYLAFASNSSNLVPGDTNNHKDVFVRGPFF